MSHEKQADCLTLSSREIRIAEACLEHAEDLVEAAEMLLHSGKHNLAFHMAVLSLEEAGRRSLFLLNLQARRKEEVDIVNEAKANDHVAKLYWAFFFPLVTLQKIDDAKLDEVRGLARALHLRRQEGLYLDANRRPFRRPKHIVSLKEARNIVSLARSQVALEKSQTIKTQGRLSREVRDLVQWFLQAGEDESSRSFIFSDESMVKLREFGNFGEWIVWLRPAYEQEAQSFTEMAQLDRLRSVEGARGSHPRWKFRIRLSGMSHRMRPSLVTEWNRAIPSIQLELGGNKKQQHLLLTLTMSDRVPLEAIYPSAKGLTERVILAFNIGTLGFFWWETAQHTQRFFEDLHDIDEGRPIVLSEVPSIQVDWFSRTLQREDLDRVQWLLTILTRVREAEFDPFAFYLEGLSFLSTINVHRHHEHYAMHAFYQSFWAAVEQSGEPHPATRSQEEFLAALPGDFHLYEPLQNLYFKGQSLVDGAAERTAISFEDVVWMKRICDFYLLDWAKRWWKLNGIQSPGQ